MTNQRNTVLYVGMTGNLYKRIKQHKGQYRGFTSKYNVTKLVYYEKCSDKLKAIKKEKQIKNLLRRKKEILINKTNSNWSDLYGMLSPLRAPA
jgi:putative endonuclease